MKHIVYTTLALVLVAALAVQAQPPHLVNYQGILADSLGVQLNGLHDLTFRIYEDSTGVTADWTEVHDDVNVQEGLFSVVLGYNTQLLPDNFTDGGQWLGIEVDGQGELSPRLRIKSVPYALHATVADTVLSLPGGASDGHSLDAVDGAPVDVVYVDSLGNVGIGTTEPTAKLHVQGVVKVGEDDSGFDLAVYGDRSGGGLFWHEEKMALRAGWDDWGNWHPDSLGFCSFATGSGTKASSSYSTAAGWGSIADGYCSFATGNGCWASGSSSTAMGWTSMASGNFSTAIGSNWTYATADHSTAIGSGANAEGERSVAIGIDANTYATGAMALGFAANASGESSVAIGRAIIAGPADNTFVIGIGSTSGVTVLENDIENSLMVGFNSNIPTLFVGSSNGSGTTGNVGIGTSAPARKLHVSDIMRLEPTSAPADPAEGDIYMDATTHKLMVYDGTQWQACW